MEEKRIGWNELKLKIDRLKISRRRRKDQDDVGERDEVGAN